MSVKGNIKFSSALIPLISEGTKSLTYRYGEKYEYLEVGDWVNIENSSTGEILGVAQIIKKDHVRFSDLPIDTEGHEKYESKEAQRAIFERYYAMDLPDGKMDDEEMMLVLEFKLSGGVRE